MRKVIGIGETILDILFKDNQPTAAVPGGSVFNGIISLGRLGANVSFISEVGSDWVGTMILNFMKENGVNTNMVSVFQEGKTPISLAFLDEHNNAQYQFYRDYPKLRLDIPEPDITSDDILIIGSYYAVAPLLRDKIKALLNIARNKGAIIYYDVNFRSSHKGEAIKLMPIVIENFEYADIIRGSKEDFQTMFNLNDGEQVYKQKTEFYTPYFIYTQGPEPIRLFAGKIQKDYPLKHIDTVSTIGAGDNFNAGIIYGMLKNHIRKEDLSNLIIEDWDKIILCGKDFSTEVCRNLSNSISKTFASGYDKVKNGR